MLSSACATVRAPGMTITLDACSSTQASTTACGEARCRSAITFTSGCAGSFLLSRPPPTGL